MRNHFEANSKTVSCTRAFIYFICIKQYFYFVTNFYNMFPSVKKRKIFNFLGKISSFLLFYVITLNWRESCNLAVDLLNFFIKNFLMLCLLFNCPHILISLNILENMHIDLGADRILPKAMMAHLLANVKMDTTKVSLSSTFSIGKKYIPFKKYANQPMWFFVWGQS